MSQDQRPDILLVLADDLGFGDIGCYGATAFETPVLDALAARGRVYRDAHASSAVCTPSRYSVLTGQYPWRSPIRSGVLHGDSPSLITEGTPTIAGTLRRAGYRTAAVGKWHLGLDWMGTDGTRSRWGSPVADVYDIDYSQPVEGGPLDHGFDTFFGIPASLDMPPYVVLRDRCVVDLPTQEKDPLITSQRPGPAAPGWDDSAVDRRFTEEAIAWLEETRPTTEEDAPRFLYVAPSAPHRPCVPPPPFAGASGIGSRADSIMMLDAYIGRILEELEKSSRECIVVFTSDNGAPTLFTEDGLLEDHAPNGPLRGQKADIHDGGHRVPLIIAGPGIPPGEDDVLVGLMDLHPSLADLVGARITDSGQGLDGICSLVPGSGASATGRSPDPRLLGATALDGSLAIMREGETAIWTEGTGGFTEPVGSPEPVGGDRGQFYDRRADPQQRCDLWEERETDRREITEAFLASTGYSEG